MARLGYDDPVPGYQVLSISSSSTGSSTDFIQYPQGYQKFGVLHVTTGSTKNISFTVEGKIGAPGVDVWTKLMAITTGSTSGALVNTTAGLTVDTLRITSTANLTTSGATKNTLYTYIIPLAGG